MCIRDSLWPLRGRITSPFGGRQIFGGENFHRGLDIAAPSGTPIAASAGGQVIWAGPKGTYLSLIHISPGAAGGRCWQGCCWGSPGFLWRGR